MKIFVTGATGYIGFAVATALRRAGHQVWGLARTDLKARTLARQEIRPVLGTLQDPASFRAAAEACGVLVHVAADYQTDTAKLDRQAVEALLATAESGPRPKTLVYTSGVWIYGDTRGDVADETTPVAPVKQVMARPATERLVLDASHVRGLVLRPGCIYGRQGGLTANWFQSALTEKAVRVIGTGANRWAMVHVDDAADCYVRAVESGLGGEVFNVTDRSRASVREMAATVCCITGTTAPIQFVPLSEASEKMGAFAECLTLDQHIDSRKAVRLLGWQPRHGGFVDSIASSYAAWQAWQQA